MMPRGVLKGVWKTSTHPVTFVVLSLLWCLDLAAGSITAYRADPDFSTRMDAYPFRLWLQEVGSRTLPHSLWIYILVLLSYLLVLSLLLCTVNWFIRRRNRLRGLGEVLVHLGFLFLFGGFVIGSTFGSRTQGIAVPVGAAAKIAGSDLALRLDDLRIRRDASGRPRETVSDITLLQGGKEAARGEVRLNHPMIHGSTVVYPRDTARRVVGAELSVAGGAPVRIAGGGALDLEGGRRLRAAALLQEGEGRGSMTGPGVFLTLRSGGGGHLGTAYLSPGGGEADGARSSAEFLSSWSVSPGSRWDSTTFTVTRGSGWSSSAPSSSGWAPSGLWRDTWG
jgi:hypothetical protein